LLENNYRSEDINFGLCPNRKFTMIKRFWHRITDRDRLCYALVIAFGICLLALMLFFQFGYQLGEREAKPFLRQEAMPYFGGYRVLLIDEPNPVVRGIEITIALGLITLGIERLINAKK